MAYADISDLTVRFGRPLTPAEQAQAEVMLDDASFLLSTKVPGLDAAIEGGDAVITNAAMLTVVAMTKRALMAQAAQRSTSPMVDQLSETFGPYSRSTKYRTDDGNLYLYASELDALLGLVRGDMSAAVSMRSAGL